MSHGSQEKFKHAFSLQYDGVDTFVDVSAASFAAGQHDQIREEENAAVFLHARRRYDGDHVVADVVAVGSDQLKEVNTG